MNKLAIFGRTLLFITWIGMAAWILIIYNKPTEKRMNVSDVSNQRTISAVEMKMVLIPAGTFKMGTEGKGDNTPVHPVRLEAYEMDKTEVTCSQYLSFCEKTGHRLPFFWKRPGFRCGPDYPDHPVIGVSWTDARAYAVWLGKRLPSEAEWEYAARGGLENQPYPDGDTLSQESGNYSKSGKQGTIKVASYAPNGFGLYDMLGNVVEWVSDRYDADYYRKSPVEAPFGPTTGRFRVIRGGGWKTGPGCTAVFHRNALPGNWIDFNVGFRCARSLSTPGEDSPEAP